MLNLKFLICICGSGGDDIKYISIALAFILFRRADQIFYNFRRWDYEKHFCDTILNLDKWLLRRCRLNKFHFSSGGYIVQQSRMVCPILVESFIMRNISVKLN